MKLLDIHLEQIANEEFRMLRGFWYAPVQDTNTHNHVRVVKPLSSNDYERLLKEFLECEYKDRVSVNYRGKWIKYYTRKMRERDIHEIARIAEGDEAKTGHLELYFKANRFSRESTQIKFAERDGSIIGYEMMFPNLHSGWFSWPIKPELKMFYSYGLWAPTSAKSPSN